MMPSPCKSFSSNPCKDFLSEIDLSTILLKHSTGLEWIQEIKHIKSDGSIAVETKKRSSVLRTSSNDNYASRFVRPKIYYSDETVV